MPSKHAPGTYGSPERYRKASPKVVFKYINSQPPNRQYSQHIQVNAKEHVKPVKVMWNPERQAYSKEPTIDVKENMPVLRLKGYNKGD